MAASGLAGVAEAAALEMAVDRKSPRVHLLQLNAIFSGAFDKNLTCSGTDIAKCLERLNGVIPAAAIEPYLKASLAPKRNGFNNYGFSTRLGRSPSTDSIAASNFSSDQGSVDSCQYSSHGSDSNSGSSPCSPEEPDRFSRAGTPQPMPPIPPALQEDSRTEDEEPLSFLKQAGTHNKHCVYTSDTRTGLCGNSERISCSDSASKATVATKSKKEPENTKHFYLQSNSCSVPNSKSVSTSSSFQRAENWNCSPTCVQSGDNSASELGLFGTCSESSSHSTEQHPLSCAKPTCVQPSFLSSANSTNQSNGSSSTHELQRCSWHQCNSSLESSDELVEHIRSQHVQVQKDKESFVCLWEGCKVYNRASCSLSWLERHVLSHGGSRPFKCIVDNCSQRFPTQAALQRHVNSHFENSQAIKANKCHSQDSFTKSFKRKKHLKYKKRTASGRTEDFFDANIMEQIQYKLIEKHTCSEDLTFSRHITFHSRIKARRVDKSGKTHILLEWTPQNILPDSWVSQDSVVQCKTVPVASLSLESLASSGLLCSAESSNAPRVKQRRK